MSRHCSYFKGQFGNNINTKVITQLRLVTYPKQRYEDKRRNDNNNDKRQEKKKRKDKEANTYRAMDTRLTMQKTRRNSLVLCLSPITGAKTVVNAHGPVNTVGYMGSVIREESKVRLLDLKYSCCRVVSFVSMLVLVFVLVVFVCLVFSWLVLCDLSLGYLVLPCLPCCLVLFFFLSGLFLSSWLVLSKRQQMGNVRNFTTRNLKASVNQTGHLFIPWFSFGKWFSLRKWFLFKKKF